MTRFLNVDSAEESESQSVPAPSCLSTRTFARRRTSSEDLNRAAESSFSPSAWSLAIDKENVDGNFNRKMGKVFIQREICGKYSCLSRDIAVIHRASERT